MFGNFDPKGTLLFTKFNTIKWLATPINMQHFMPLVYHSFPILSLPIMPCVPGMKNYKKTGPSLHNA